MIFRDATLNDLPVIVEIYNSTIPGRMVTADMAPVAIEDKLSWFSAHNSNNRPLWMVETEEKEIIGWVSLQDFYGRPAYDGTAEISIYLHQDQRGKGYGHQILEGSIAQAASMNINNLLGFIFAHNLPSISLFKKAGFEEWGHLKDVAILDGKPYSLKILGRKIAN